MKALVAIFQFPIMILNIFGFAVSAIWLLFIGEWKVVIVGLVVSVFAPKFLGFALLFGMIVDLPAHYFAKRGVAVGVYFFQFLSSAFTYIIIGSWCGAVIFACIHNAPPHAFWPLLIWSYGVATSPWSYMAQVDQGIASILGVFFTQAAFIVLMVCVAFGMDVSDAFQVFCLVLVIGVIFHMRLVAEAQRYGALTE
jgi:hypothetical protein